MISEQINERNKIMLLKQIIFNKYKFVSIRIAVQLF